MQRLIVGALSVSAALTLGCLSVLGDFTLAPDGSGGATGSSSAGDVAVSSVTSSAGDVAVSSVTSSAGGGAPPEVRCGMGSMAELRDDFTDSEASLKMWDPDKDIHASIDVVDGALHMKADGTEQAYADLYSKEERSLRDCAAYIEVKQVAAIGPVGIYFSLEAQDGYMEIYLYAGLLCFGGSGSTMNDPDFDECPVTYDKDKHRFWRIREQGGKTYFETSPTGQAGTYSALHDVPTPSYAGAFSLDIGMWTEKATPTPLEVVFDNLNVPPP